MDTIFMNSENSRTSKPQFLTLKLIVDLKSNQISNQLNLLHMEEHKRLIQ